MIVQIYEIQTAREAETMIELGVDHVGSVLLSSDRGKDPELKNTVRQVQAAGCKSSLIPLFGQIDAISRAVEFYQPDILHLCEILPGTTGNDSETERRLKGQRKLKERFPELEIMRSIPIGRKGQGDVVPSLAYGMLFEPWSDWFLTDTLLIHDSQAKHHDQPVEGYVGITGLTCDWEIAAALVRQSRIPVILAGGIGPRNVAQGILRVCPAGVDSCTLTNAVDDDGQARRFRKDPDKVKLMIQNARAATDKL
ncbi:MAG: hypothetical protein P8X96_16500 [Desulfobacteraceae bacterium]|jgi:phosphoribosylanthranilate isomerase